MNDLDRKIAELKGWRPITQGDYDRIEKTIRMKTVYPCGICRDRPDGGLDVANDAIHSHTWSTSDAKAFELVDEMLAAIAGRMDVSIYYASSPGVWNCDINVDSMTEVERWGRTRPEAICRAYIALKEWEKKR